MTGFTGPIDPTGFTGPPSGSGVGTWYGSIKFTDDFNIVCYPIGRTATNSLGTASVDNISTGLFLPVSVRIDSLSFFAPPTGGLSQYNAINQFALASGSSYDTVSNMTGYVSSNPTNNTVVTLSNPTVLAANSWLSIKMIMPTGPFTTNSCSWESNRLLIILFCNKK